MIAARLPTVPSCSGTWYSSFDVGVFETCVNDGLRSMLWHLALLALDSVWSLTSHGWSFAWLQHVLWLYGVA